MPELFVFNNYLCQDTRHVTTTISSEYSIRVALLANVNVFDHTQQHYHQHIVGIVTGRYKYNI